MRGFNLIRAFKNRSKESDAPILNSVFNVENAIETSSEVKLFLFQFYEQFDKMYNKSNDRYIFQNPQGYVSFYRIILNYFNFIQNH